MARSVKKNIAASTPVNLLLTAQTIQAHADVIEQLLANMAPALSARAVDRIHNAASTIRAEAGLVCSEVSSYW